MTSKQWTVEQVINLWKDPIAKAKQEKVKRIQEEAHEIGVELLAHICKHEKFGKLSTTSFNLAISGVHVALLKGIKDKAAQRGALAATIGMFVDAIDPLSGCDDPRGQLANVYRACGYVHPDSVKVQALCATLAGMTMCLKIADRPGGLQEIKQELDSLVSQMSETEAGLSEAQQKAKGFDELKKKQQEEEKREEKKQ